jgi:adenosylcobinamide amidohydrolase
MRIATILLSALLLAPAAPAQSSKTVLIETPQFRATRDGKYVVVELLSPHRVLSTSPRTGGQSETVRYLVNHQSMEPAGDIERHDKLTSMTERQYHVMVATKLGVEPMEMALMGTAANMNYMAHKLAEFLDLRVDAFVTAGVESNATRSGDPARWYEADNGVEHAPVAPGTINTIVLVNKPLTPGAQAKAAVMISEAKAAALAELAVPSGVSSHLATGTGTDQFILAAPIDLSARPLQNAGSHMKLGELLGVAVRAATIEALRWQNGLEPSYTRSITRALGRFGLSERELLSRLKANLPSKTYDLLVQNQLTVTMEPKLSAATFAYAAILDRLQYGTIPPNLAGEVLRDQAANVAIALSATPGKWNEFWSEIPANSKDRLDPFVIALVLGWQSRWAE